MDQGWRVPAEAVQNEPQTRLRGRGGLPIARAPPFLGGRSLRKPPPEQPSPTLRRRAKRGGGTGGLGEGAGDGAGSQVCDAVLPPTDGTVETAATRLRPSPAAPLPPTEAASLEDCLRKSLCLHAIRCGRFGF